MKNKFTLRMYDYFDGWIDISSHASLEEANKAWSKETLNGTRYTEYKTNGYYFKVFPSDTKMLWTPDFLGR